MREKRYNTRDFWIFLWGNASIRGVGVLLAASMQFVTGLGAAPIRVIEETAIPFASFLAKSEFDARFPGELLEDPAALNRGWYVIYQHEALNYYFGPILFESTGRDYLIQLQTMVAEAVAKRPSIVDYQIELSFEPRLPSEAASTQREDEVSPPNGASSRPKLSFWQRVKQVFWGR